MITVKEKLLTEIDRTSDPHILSEVLDFLISKKMETLPLEKQELLLISEVVLAKDWLTVEEEQAWQNL